MALRSSHDHFRSIHNIFFGNFGSRFLPKSIGTSVYSRSVAALNMMLIGTFLLLWSAHAFSSDLFLYYKMVTNGHFLDELKSLSIAFLVISDQYVTKLFFSQNGSRRTFWMTENHFLSHFSPFQINTRLLFF